MKFRYLILFALLFAFACNSIYAMPVHLSRNPAAEKTQDARRRTHIAFAVLKGASNDFAPDKISKKEIQGAILAGLILALIIYFFLIRPYFGKKSIFSDRESWGHWSNRGDVSGWLRGLYGGMLDEGDDDAKIGGASGKW